RTVREEEVYARLQSGSFEDGQNHVARRRRVRAAFEDHQLTAAQAGGDRFGRIDDVRKVRFAGFGERGRHTDDYHVRFAQSLGVGRGIEPIGPHLLHGAIGDVSDVALAAAQLFDLVRVGVEPEHAESAGGEYAGQWQADVAQPDDPDERGAVAQTG